MNKYCIVVTGLPGSGKTTVGNEVSKLLDIPLLDKDDYLERLFDKRGVGDAEWRQKLSREADEYFIDESKSIDEVILISHWRPANITATFGTPTKWLEENFDKVIELYCDCSVEIAALRFTQRKRHVGHVDKLKTYDEIVRWLCEYEQYLPIGFGERINVKTRDTSWRTTLKQNVKNTLT